MPGSLNKPDAHDHAVSSLTQGLLSTPCECQVVWPPLLSTPSQAM